jgi:hypothetical protein
MCLHIIVGTIWLIAVMSVEIVQSQFIYLFEIAKELRWRLLGATQGQRIVVA